MTAITLKQVLLKFKQYNRKYPTGYKISLSDIALSFHHLESTFLHV